MMSSRLSSLSLQKLYQQKSSLRTISCFGPKYYCLTTPDIKEPLATANMKSVQVIKPVQSLLDKPVDEILSRINDQYMSLAEAVTILKALRMNILFKNINSDSFKSDKNFIILCQLFEKNCCVMRPSMLVSGLRSLLEVGVPSESSSVKSAEQSIINNIHLFSVFNIIGCLYFHHKYMETDLQKYVVAELVNNLCKRLSEISSSAEILMLSHFLHIFTKEELKIVQSKIVEFVFNLSGSEMCKMLNTLSENSFRNVTILNALALNIKDKLKDLSMKEMLGILYVCKNLNFVHSNLLSDLMQEMVSRICDEKLPSTISGLLTTCGHLRWKQQNVLNACGEWIKGNLEVCRQKEFVSYILTVATLNCNDSNTMDTLKTIIPLLSPEKIESPDVWLDIIWSLAVLNFVTKDMLLKVFSPDFYKPLIDGSDFQQVTNKIKLMNLKAVLKMHYPECIFGIEFYLDPVQIPQTLENEQKKRHVINVLSNFVPKEKYLCLNQNTDIGIFIDAEFIMNKNQKPMPLLEFGILSKPTTKPLPKDCHRIALLVYFHKDYTNYLKSATGKIALGKQLLWAHGYTVVLISFQEFIQNDTEIKKAKHLLGKITQAMKKAASVHNAS